MAGALRLAGGAARMGALVLALALGGAAEAGEAQDRLFALGALGDVATGTTLVYDFTRTGDYPEDKLGKIAHGEARLSVEAGGEGGARTAVALLRDDEKQIAHFDPFPGDAGNPMFMVFMEETVATMAKLTGGSAFYIRNRMREALGAQDAVSAGEVDFAGRTVPARTLTFQPFLHDKNAAKMGPAFQAMTITFVMSDEIPGAFARMEAVAAAPAGAGEAAGAPLLDLGFRLAKIEES